MVSPLLKSESSLRYRRDIDGLRAVAILAVIGFHAFPDIIRGGFIGVDIFFVISGFLISTIIFRHLDKGDFSFIDFYARRIRRIFPALILVLLTSYAFGWWALVDSEYRQLGKHIAAGAGFVLNFILWDEVGYFDDLAETKPLLHLWSLAIEEQFYLIWPLALWFFHKKRFNLLWSTCAVALLSFGLSLYAKGAFFAPHARFWELMVGAILAHLMLYPKPFLARWQNAERETLFSWVGSGLIVIGILLIDKSRTFPGWWALLPTVGAALIIAAGMRGWANRYILSGRLMVGIGLISYPLYLWHWPLLTFARLLTNGTPPALVRMAAIALSFVLAWLTYVLLEKPIRFGAHSRGKTIGLLVVMVAVGCVGYHCYFKGGRPLDELRVSLVQFYGEDPFGEPIDSECTTRFPQFASYHRCRLSRPSSSPEILIIGDSHTGHYYEAVAQKWPNKTVMNLSFQACLPFVKSTNCRDVLETTYAFIEQQDSIKTVYLAGFWYHLMVGGCTEDIDAGCMLLPLNKKTVPDFKAVGKAYIARLLKAGKRVVFVKDNPNLNFNPLRCISRRPVKAMENVRVPCAMDRREFDNTTAEHRAAIDAIIAPFPDLIVFDSKRYLCNKRFCWAMKDGKLLYRDSHHLGEYGIALFAADLPL